MIGRDLPTQERVSLKPGEAVLSLVGVDVAGAAGVRLLEDAHLEVRSHEIIGVAGVSGNGQEALFQVISGLTTPASGEVTVLGNSINNLAPADLVEMGVARIPEDRYATGLIADMSVWENLIAERYRSDAMQRFGFFRRNAALAYADAIIAEYDVRCPSPHMTTRLLSGGNMQKLILGRTLSHDPRLIVANQPTRGLDVGAVSFVRERLLEAKERGAGILLISEDLDELLDLSDHLVVMFEGRTSTPLRHEEGSIRKLGLMMAGHFDEAHHEI
jgi:simple sugar transport system ATP-binding protein